MEFSWDEIWQWLASQLDVLRGDSSTSTYREVVECLEDCFFRFFRSRGFQDADAECLAAFVVAQVTINIATYQAPIDDLTPHGCGSFRGWCFTIARNAERDHYVFLNGRGQQFPESEDGKNRMEPVVSRADIETSEPIHLQALSACVEMLTTTQRGVLLRRVVDGWAHEEIAEWLGKSVDAVRKEYQRAKQRLLELAEADPDICKAIRRWEPLSDEGDSNCVEN